MKVYRTIESFESVENAVVTIGTFDGVHQGHVSILNRLREIADQISGETVIITFHPHPRYILYPDDDSLKMLTTIEEKISIFNELGIDHLLILPFDEKISQLEPEDFVRDILVNTIGVKHIVIGYDHRFGKNRKGDYHLMEKYATKYGFQIEEIEPYIINELTVSSTKIRQALLYDDDIQIANQLLGRFYSISGKVIHGNKQGRLLGFPTCNIDLQEIWKLIPRQGIYIAYAQLQGQVYQSMVNIGNKPTMGDFGLSVEAYLFDFNREVYGENLELKFIKRIRNEVKFDSIEALIDQIQKDVIIGKQYFSEQL